MNIQIASDLHLEWLDGRFGDDTGLRYAECADVLVIAGDIQGGSRALAAFERWPVPVVYVHGNHEHYREDMAANVGQLRILAAGGNIRYLECGEWRHQGGRFLGCCLWTNDGLVRL